MAEVIERIELGDLLQLGPQDVLRLVMLLSLRSGALEAAADYARRLLPTWAPYLANVDEECAHRRQAMVVNRLVRELHDPALPPGEHRFAGPWGAAAPAGRLASPPPAPAPIPGAAAEG